MKWRVGRSLGRTLYIQTGPEPSKEDFYVGIMDSENLADHVVAAVNTVADLRAKVEALFDEERHEWQCVQRADVLALIDGSNDE